ncbi:MAG: ABC transporter permease [Deltaproteobacteria bacterium]|nr:ABC transporter permease [Deltaproteobacteria bacterium]
MRYEAKVGWRYLYSGKADRLMLRLALAAFAASVAGLGIVLVAPGNTAGVALFVGGLVLTAVLGLMSVFSVFTSVSMLGVAFGVAALTVVLAVTTGFQQQFRDKVLGVHAHVVVMRGPYTFPEYREVMEKAQAVDPDVVSVQPFILAEMLATRGKGELSGVGIKGVDPMRAGGVLDLEQHVVACEPAHRDAAGACAGAVRALGERRPGQPPPIIMGKELAHKLKAQLGDEVTVVVPLSNLDPDTWRAKSAPRTRKFRVSAIFYSGFDEYDRRLMYASIADTQELVGRGDEALGVELKVADVDRARDIADELGRALGPTYQVQDWYEMNHNLFMALKLQKLALVFILTLIMVVAAVNMVSALTMMVTDKTREIAILKSMGATSGSVARVFQLVGAAIGGIGTLIGLAVGLATCAVMSSYGFRLDPKVYLIDRLPIDVRWLEVVAVVAGTMLISVVATVVPSGSASSLRPVDGLRYD